ncbi:MAG: CoB--CoM heterodisulfide reductase iron-sulfur subunit A family protein [Thermoplasmata archaeon]
MDAKTGAVLVVGGGIAGVQASLDLADLGFKVYLLDEKPAIGGVMAQLDKTFPTNDCSMCILAPKLVGAGRHPNIELLTNSEVLGLSGEAGDFRVRVLRRPRYIRSELCTGCGICAQKCPSKVPNEFDMGLSKRKAAYVLFPQAVPLKYAIDREHCIYFKTGKCGNCKKNCPAGAVDFEMKPEELELAVGAVVIAPGFSPYSPPPDNPYGYGRFRNVVTSMEFERILSASGPYGGHVQRPSDGRAPRNVAFIQCVGSRDARTNPWCSSVCCMYATKEAIIAREHSPDLRAAIFYMDMRAFGKEFEYYHKRARSEYGVRYIRSRAPSVSELADGSLIIRYETDTGELREEVFDMVVLSVGLCPPAGLGELARRLGVGLDGHGFVSTSGFAPMETGVPGIYVCGASQGPKDIPDSVAQASGAAALAARGIASERGKLVAKKEYPPELDITGQRPRIGVFVCHCGINIGGVVNVPEVTEYAKTLPDVVHAEHNLYSCSQDTQKRIREKIVEHRLNRVVVASCTPRTHEPLFQETCREAGLNPYLFEMANIRDQCSWVHMHEPMKATAKAKKLVRAAVAKARNLQPLSRRRMEVRRAALVVGGGVSGMTAAIELASQGVQVTLVERERELGGLARRLHRTIEGEDVRERLHALEEKLRSSELVRILTASRVKKIEGYVGKYSVVVESAGGGGGETGAAPATAPETTIECGTIIVATGAREYRPEEHLYGRDPRVLTQLELEERLLSGGVPEVKTAVFVQCVGSRSEKRGYCSRVCCTASVKNALELKRLNPGASVYILYRDIRTYGPREEWYRRAREEGIEFLRHEDGEPPLVELEGGELRVTVREPLLDRKLVIRPDIVVLSPALLPPEGSPELARMLKVPLTKDGFFLEAHMKLRPVEFATSGVFLCGACSSPKFMDECISQAEAAAMKALILLQSGYIETEPYVSEIREDKCTGCQVCLRVCPFSAIDVVEGKVRVIAELCKGCGLCNAACPSGAIQQHGFRDNQLLEMLRACGGG